MRSYLHEEDFFVLFKLLGIWFVHVSLTKLIARILHHFEIIFEIIPKSIAWENSFKTIFVRKKTLKVLKEKYAYHSWRQWSFELAAEVGVGSFVWI